MTDGEVRKVSKDTGKITPQARRDQNLDMPPMTMVFQVKDTGLLDKVKAGRQGALRGREGRGRRLHRHRHSGRAMSGSANRPPRPARHTLSLAAAASFWRWPARSPFRPK